MKTFYFLFICILLSCTDQGPTKTYNYTVSNESGKQITIKSFRSDFPNADPIITKLEIGEIISKEFEDTLPPEGYNFKDFFGGGSRLQDSLVVNYNNERKNYFKQECNSNNRNPIDICIYDGLNEIFIFTTDDFDNANDCNGNCN